MNKREQKALFSLLFLIITGGLILVYYLLKFIWNILSAPSRKKAKEKRRAKLIEKYNDAVIVSKIMTNSIWVGQTAEQLEESIGMPENIDQKILKTKKKETWKYYNQGGNKYGLRVTLDNDEVIGWDEKL